LIRSLRVPMSASFAILTGNTLCKRLPYTQQLSWRSGSGRR
jgi:hypothetical protein